MPETSTCYESDICPLLYADQTLVQRGDFVLRLTEKQGRIVHAVPARVWDTLYYDNGLPIGTVLVDAAAPKDYLPKFEGFALEDPDGLKKYYFRTQDILDEHKTKQLLSPLFRSGNYIKIWHEETLHVVLYPVIRTQPYPQPSDFAQKRFFLKTLINLAKGGEPVCLFVAALRYRSKGRYQEAIRCLQASAEQHYAAAWLELGIEYSENGMMLEHNSVKAAQCFLYAAKNGNSLGQYYTAVNMIHGHHNIPQSDSEALFWLKKAAEQNIPEACLEAGRYYWHGSFNHLRPKNSIYRLHNRINEPIPELAATMFAKATLTNWEGVAIAKYYLAECYRLGLGVHYRPAHAVKLYREAVAEGNWMDEEIQSAAYHAGNIVVLETAADSGQPYAAYLLGKMYWHGEHLVGRDRMLGRKYLRQAMESPHECAVEAAELLQDKDDNGWAFLKKPKLD